MKISIQYKERTGEALKQYCLMTFLYLFALALFLGVAYIGGASQTIKQSVLYIWIAALGIYTINVLFLKNPYLHTVLLYFAGGFWGPTALILGYFCVYVFGYTTFLSDCVFAFVFICIIALGIIESGYVDLNKFKNKAHQAGALEKHGENVIYFRSYGDMPFISQTTRDNLLFLWYFDKCFLVFSIIFLLSAGIVAYTSVDNLWGINEQWIFCFVFGSAGILTRSFWTITVLWWRTFSAIKAGEIKV